MRMSNPHTYLVIEPIFDDSNSFQILKSPQRGFNIEDKRKNSWEKKSESIQEHDRWAWSCWCFVANLFTVIDDDDPFLIFTERKVKTI